MWTCLAQCWFLGDALGDRLLSFPSGLLTPSLSPSCSLVGQGPALVSMRWMLLPPLPPLHRLLKRSAASATPQSPGWEGRQRGGKAAPRACGRDRLPPSPGTPTSRRFFLTSKYQSAWGQPRSPFSGSLRNIGRCARKPLPSHPSPPPLPRPPRCQCWLRGKEPPGSCGGRPAGDH